jgi:hypothetical protein
VVCKVSVQKIQDRAPKAISDLSPVAEAMIAFITYRGLVPIFPYTTPRVIISPENVTFLNAEFFRYFPIFLKKNGQI